jgi:hypothetical protein
MKINILNLQLGGVISIKADVITRLQQNNIIASLATTVPPHDIRSLSTRPVHLQLEDLVSRGQAMYIGRKQEEDLFGRAEGGCKAVEALAMQDSGHIRNVP